MIDIAVFDVAGTTVEEHGAVYAVLADTVRAQGVDPTPAEIAMWMGADKRTAIANLLGDRGDVEAGFADFRARLERTYRDNPPQPMPGVVDLFAELRANGVRIALTTGFDLHVTQLVLNAVGWDDTIIDTVVCTDDVPTGRPAPFMVFRAMERTGCVDVRRVLVAGDTARDVESGLNAGAGIVVGVRSGGVDDATLAVEPRVVVLDGAADIAGVLDSYSEIEEQLATQQ